jgi:hypothetical protein
MNGALNNASMAIEIGLADPARADDRTTQMLRTGLGAIGQASRAAALLAHLVHGRGVPPEDNGLYRRDVQEILREQTHSTGAPPLAQPDSGADGSAADAAEWLVAELARMHVLSTSR